MPSSVRSRAPGASFQKPALLGRQVGDAPRSVVHCPSENLEESSGLQLLHLSQHLFDIDFRFCLHLRYGQRQPLYSGLLEQDAQRQFHPKCRLSRVTTRVASSECPPARRSRRGCRPALAPIPLPRSLRAAPLQACAAPHKRSPLGCLTGREPAAPPVNLAIRR